MDKENRTKNFRLSLVDDKTHRNIWVLRFTRGSLALLLIAFVLILLTGAFLAVAYTPLRNIVPARQEPSYRHQAIQNAMKIDSLEATILQWELYSENLKRVVRGEEPIRLDSLIRLGNARRGQTMTPEMLRQDSLLRQLVREEEQFQVGGAVRQLSIEGLNFFPPVKGTVSEPFDRSRHPYTVLTAPDRSVVKSVLDGTLIYSDWQDDGGYSLAVQHGEDIVSIYRHCPDILKKPSDRITAGTAIALTGKDPVVFELWYRGEAVDPSLYITF